ncbi:MAG: class I SAM-dependent methyltransferase [Alphaproteobacteria bacterium]|nr:class I SAM-dependent methyltransferase [Alphaproteobacteria bacterium]
MTLLDPRNLSGAHFNVIDAEKFQRALQLLRESLFDGGATMFAADNLITWNRNLSLLRDDFFLENLRGDQWSLTEKSTVWRLYILLYFAEAASHVPGDFLELGCYTGHTAENVIKKIDFKKLKKKYYLYDLFEWNEGDGHTHLPAHDTGTMYGDAVKRFEKYPFVKLIKGSVPGSFAEGFPEKIAFAHIDMNHPDPEAGALDKVLPALSPGGIVVFDDYGWWGYSAQKQALDPIAEKHGLKILELPTGQALLMKPAHDKKKK